MKTYFVGWIAPGTVTNPTPTVGHSVITADPGIHDEDDLEKLAEAVRVESNLIGKPVLTAITDITKGEEKRPTVSVGLICIRDGKILLGKRKSKIGNGLWALPGGKQDWNEDHYEAAARETKEETGLIIDPLDIEFVAPLDERIDGLHFVFLIHKCDQIVGEVVNMEPEKCDGWIWHPLDQPLPQPLWPQLDEVLMEFVGATVV